jgi:hypothetical protein
MEEVSLIKIDIEGAECMVLQSSKDFLAKYKPIIFLSLHPFWFPDKENDISKIWDAVCDTYDVTLIFFDGEKVLHESYAKEGFIEAQILNKMSDVLLIPKK